MIADLPQPIIVLGAPRSGTSMTAGLFAQHGAWTGACKPADSRKARGYFENLAFKQHLVAESGRLVTRCKLADVPEPGEWRKRVRDVLDREGYEGGPWCVKHSALYAPVWLADFDPVFVCCFRWAADIRASGTHTGMIEQRIARHTIDLHHRYMRDLVTHLAAHEVWPDAFMRDEWGEIEKAFTHAGMDFDRDIARDFVDAGLWHQWTANDATA